jgi:flavin-dependent dehydrogenase
MGDRPHQVPVAVIGGGPAGASAGRALARHGIETLLIERSDGSGNPVGECLAPSANPLLHHLELHDALRASAPLPSFGNRSAWGGDGSLVDRDFLREPFGHGWHLDRPAFNASLLTAAERDGVTVWRRSRVATVDRDGGVWRVGVETAGGARTVAAEFLVDASGRAAAVARRYGGRRRRSDGLVAAVAIFERVGAVVRDAATLLEAADRGWWYSALLPHGRLVVVWFTDPDLLAADAAWRRERWWDLLEASDATRERVMACEVERAATIQVMAAGSGIVLPPVGDGWIAAGDAAAAFDPLSSHGIASALGMGHRAARAVAACLRGDAAAITAYGDGILAEFARYLWLQHAYYAEEQRWPEAPFWQRRHGGAGAHDRGTRGA